MNGYFCVLTIIDFFILCFMCILTYLSESLSRKQKRGFLLAFVLIAGISILEVITLVVDGLPPAYRWLNVASIIWGLVCLRLCASVLCMYWTGKQSFVVRSGLRYFLKSDIWFSYLLLFHTELYSPWAQTIFIRVVHIFIYISSCILGQFCIFRYLRLSMPENFRIAANC